MEEGGSPSQRDNGKTWNGRRIYKRTSNDKYHHDSQANPRTP